MTAHYERRGDVAVLQIDNPPVNGLGHSTSKALFDGLEQALDDAKVRAIVVTGTATVFSGGADIREFNQPRTPPDLPEVNDMQDALQKPLVAAIGGFALGGGLELALGCHYRIAAPKSLLGLPRGEARPFPARAARSACRASSRCTRRRA